MTVIATGFFTMEDTTIVLAKSLDQAKEYLSVRVTEFVKEHPGVDPKNVTKANKMIFGARSTKALAIDVANFVLAHTSENLSVL